jgi:hypothetical protein
MENPMKKWMMTGGTPIWIPSHLQELGITFIGPPSGVMAA